MHVPTCLCLHPRACVCACKCGIWISTYLLALCTPPPCLSVYCVSAINPTLSLSVEMCVSIFLSFCRPPSLLSACLDLDNSLHRPCNFSRCPLDMTRAFFGLFYLSASSAVKQFAKSNTGSGESAKALVPSNSQNFSRFC
jgi:hypothetical protein